MQYSIEEIKTSKKGVFVIPIGGCGEFGMNMTAYIHNGQLNLVDAGILFSEPWELGVSSAFPKIDELVKVFGKVNSYVITHGHEDHIGAVPFLVKRWPAKIYATPWTAALIERKFQRYGVDAKKNKVNVVVAGDKVQLGQINFEYYHVNHSIPDACALIIRTPEGVIFHTGDFKLDPENPFDKPMNIPHMEALGRKGVDLLLADSTNASTPGFGASEQSVFEPMVKQIESARGRVFFSTFSSNLWRLLTLVKACEKTGRKLAITGRGNLNTFSIAEELGMFKIPPNILVEEDEVPEADKDNLVVLATGCQAERHAAVMRICKGEHRTFRIEPGDKVIFSSRSIPGNEKNIQMLMAELRKQGAEVISSRQDPSLHVSGHACEEEINVLLKALNPKYYLPIHGSFSHLIANGEIGAANHRCHLVEDGNIIRVEDGKPAFVGSFDVETVFVDDDSQELMEYSTMRERHKIGESGATFASAVYDREQNKWLTKLEINFQGIAFPLNVNRDNWVKKTSNEVIKGVNGWLNQNKPTVQGLNDQVRHRLRKAVQTTLRRRNPLVFTTIHLVGEDLSKGKKKKKKKKNTAVTTQPTAPS